MSTLEVDPAVLQSAATSFGHAVDELSSLQADAPLIDPAAAVVSDGACQFSVDLGDAARWYEMRDQAAANAIERIETP